MIYINPRIQGHLTALDLVADTATFDFVTDVRTVVMGNTMFHVDVPGFLFSLRFANSSVIFQRWGHHVVFPVTTSDPAEKLRIRCVYEPHKMAQVVGDKQLFAEMGQLATQEERDAYLMSRFMSRDITPPQTPPPSLESWLRKELLLRPASYFTYDQVKDEVAGAFVSLYAKIEANSMWPAFWDGPEVTAKGRKPKPEIKVQPTLAALLSDQCLLRNLDLSPEVLLSGGNLDFCVTGYVSGVGMSSVCVEVKNAHAGLRQLNNGLTNQLPAYMRAKGADFGIYVVLWYKGRYFSKPTRFSEILQLDDHLHELRRTSGLGRIRIMCLDLSDSTPPPSKRGDRKKVEKSGTSSSSALSRKIRRSERR